MFLSFVFLKISTCTLIYFPTQMLLVLTMNFSQRKPQFKTLLPKLYSKYFHVVFYQKVNDFKINLIICLSHLSTLYMFQVLIFFFYSYGDFSSNVPFHSSPKSHYNWSTLQAPRGPKQSAGKFTSFLLCGKTYNKTYRSTCNSLP